MRPAERAGVWQKLLTALLLLAAVGFLARTAAEHWEQIRAHDWEIRPGILLLSIAAHVAVLCWGVWIWSLVLRRFGIGDARYPSLLRIWSLSNVARYVPGSVWQFLAAAQLSYEAGIPRLVGLSSMLVHVGYSLLAAVTISALTVPLEALGLAATPALAARAGVLLVALALVHPAVLNGALGVLSRVARRPLLRWSGGWADGLLLLALANLSWILYGVAYFLFVDAVTDVPLLAFPALTAVNALSFAAGYVVVFAPGGLGVREAAMTLLLMPILPAGLAAVLSVAARLWSVVTEVLLALGSALVASPRRAAGRAAGPRDETLL